MTFNWNDELAIAFAQISAGGAYGHYKGCKTIQSKLERFKKLNHDNMEKQRVFQARINAQLGLNIVTCGQCGNVLIHHTDDEYIICPHCGFDSESCDFPDLYS